MADFLWWNNAIAEHFFRPVYAGRTVYLYVTPDVIEEIGGVGSVPSFVECMKAGPSWATRPGVCQKALQAMDAWRLKGLPFPPFIGYLALFVLAAGREGDFAVHAYYPRLRSLLGEEPVSGTYPSFGRMHLLWDDLADWLNHENAGSLGILRADVAGAWPHVGLPTAQAVLTETERERLHRVFDEAGLDPDFPPPDLELARIVHARGSGALRKRTLNALEDVRSEYGAVLVDRILEELESWDETSVTDDNDASADAVTANRGHAILCLPVVDEISHRVKMEMRCRFPEPFPDSVALVHEGATYTCKEGAAGYSTALSDASGGRFNPASLNWQRGAFLRSADSATAVHWQGGALRVFADGRERGLPGFVEVQSFDPSRAFIIACSLELQSPIRSWGEGSCEGFRELTAPDLPDGWSFFAGKRATDDALIRDIAPRLSFSAELRRVRLTGGIHVPGLQSYFRFAPPTIRLDGGLADETIDVNGLKLPREEDGSFSIPEELLTENILVITAGHLKRLVYLEDGSSAQPEWRPRLYATDGRITGDAEVNDVLPCGIPAAAAEGAIAAYEYPPIPPGVRATAIGRTAGEIADFKHALTFAPAWIVFHRGRDVQTAEYVARELLDPVVAAKTKRAALHDWKELLWHHRKRIAPPAFEPLRRLWLKYQKAAQDA